MYFPQPYFACTGAKKYLIRQTHTTKPSLFILSKSHLTQRNYNLLLMYNLYILQNPLSLGKTPQKDSFCRDFVTTLFIRSKYDETVKLQFISEFTNYSSLNKLKVILYNFNNSHIQSFLNCNKKKLIVMIK